MNKKALTQSRLREVFDYDPLTGTLTWKIQTSRRVRVGDAADVVNKEGYVQVGIDGQRRLGHHIAWVWWYGAMPDGDVDHINRVRSDNRIANLRCVSRTENLLNSDHSNETGYPGVTKVPSGRYRAAIHINRVCTYIGTYDTAIEAFEIYAERHVALYGTASRYHPNHPNRHQLIGPTITPHICSRSG